MKICNIPPLKKKGQKCLDVYRQPPATSVMLQRRVTEYIINLIVTVNVLSTCSLVNHVDYSI